MDFGDKQKQCAEMFSAFRAILREYTARLTDAVKDCNLSPNEIAVLGKLSEESSASKIAREGGVSKALVSRSVKLLRYKGLIDVAISANDKREQSLTLTSEGEKIAKTVKAANDSFAEDALHNVDSEAVEMMRLLLAIVIRNLGLEDEKQSDGEE